MNTKQVVAVIGASGKMGSALARTLAKGNYRILLHSSNTIQVELLLNEIRTIYPAADIEIANNYFETGWAADVVILAVPYAAEKLVAEKIRTVVNQKVVISVSNPLNDYYDELLTTEISAAEELQDLLPNAKVIKAFNTVRAVDFYHQGNQQEKPDCFIACSDEDALELVYDLVKTAGFKPVIAGDLSMSRTLESMQLLLVQVSMQNNCKEIAGLKILYNENLFNN